MAKKKRKSKKVRLGEVSVGANTYDVYLVPYDYPTLVADNKSQRYVGCIIWSAREIHLADNLPKHELPFILFHELTHAALEAAGRSQWKEDFLRPFTHIIWSSLKDAGFISDSLRIRPRRPSTHNRNVRHKYLCE